MSRAIRNVIEQGEVGRQQNTLAIDGTSLANTSTFDTQGRSRVSWIADLTALSGGTTPDVTFSWQHSPDDTTWFTIASEAALTGAGTKSRYVTTDSLMRYVRISWALTGAPTTVTINTYIYAA